MDLMIKLRQVIGFNINKEPKIGSVGIISCLNFIDVVNLSLCAKLFHRIDLPRNAVLKCKNRIIPEIDFMKRKYIGRVSLPFCMSHHKYIEEVIELFPNLAELDLMGSEIYQDGNIHLILWN